MARAVGARVLIAAVGSTLRGDDGFGPALFERIYSVLPEGVDAIDFGTHGIALVQAFYAGYDAAVLLDSCIRRQAPGTVYVLKPDVPQIHVPVTTSGLDALADSHVAEPAKALMLAQALGVLPRDVWLVGCEPQRVEDHHVGLSAAVTLALPAATRETLALVRRIQSDHAAR